MGIERVAIIFDNKARPDTTGVYCRRALGELVDVEHFLPSEISRLHGNEFDLFLNIDDGLRYRLPQRLRPSAWWAIDTHLDFAWYREKAPDFDYVFAAQRDGASQLRSAGFETATWLPLACDPQIHCRHEVRTDYDVSFVGHVFPGPRQDLLERIKTRFPKSFVGQAFFEDMARIYSASRTVFNRSLCNDVNMRVFEALACGSLLLTNDLADNGQSELFRDGVHLATYAYAEELFDKLHFYLKRPGIRQRIADQGRREALARHTYRHRLEHVLATIAVAGSPKAGQLFVKAPQIAETPNRITGFIAQLPQKIQSALLIGATSPHLIAVLTARQCRVTAIVDNLADAASGMHGVDELLIGPLVECDTRLVGRRFDVIVVDQHLELAAAELCHFKERLSTDGVLILTLAPRNPTGTADSCDSQNFAQLRHDIEVLAYRTGYRASPLNAGQLDALQTGELPTECPVALFALTSTSYGLTSIIILTYNQLEYTRLCIDSLRAVTDEPIELIIVDNASTDGTVEYLRGLEGITLITNVENRGFPAGVNQGIEASHGEQVLLLNNDCVLTVGWLSRQLDALASDRQIGLVGPCSNCVSGSQQIAADYNDLADLERFSWQWGTAHDRQLVEAERLVGFCLLIRREVIDRIGTLDERFGIGNFEDDDYCMRARAAGFRTVVAQSAFVHHFGHRSFVGSGIDLNSLLERNERLFEVKWRGADRVSGPAIMSREAPRGDCYRIELGVRGGLLLKKKHIHLSLCMIVRDSACTLGACLESIRPWVDEIVVVDTGSQDETIDIAKSFGSRLFHFPWCDDFSAARNESLRHASGEWLFWMDSDDTIDAENGAKLRALATDARSQEFLGYVMQVHCPGGSGLGLADVTVVDHVKLFRNRPDLRFEGRIHEQILPAIRQLNGDVGWTDIFVVHSGSDQSPHGRKQKQERDLRILARDLSDRPNHPFVLFNLGMTHSDMEDHDQAISYLQASLAVSDIQESHVRKAHALLIGSLTRSDQLDAASRACRDALVLFPDDPELLFRSGIVAHQTGRLQESIDAYVRALADRDEKHFSSMDRGIVGFKARHNLAMVYEDVPDIARAEEQWRRAVEEMPAYRDGWRGLAENLLRQKKLEDVRTVRQHLATIPALRAESHRIAVQLANANEDFAEARRVLETGLEEFADDLDLIRAACQFYFQHGGCGEALPLLEQLVVREPNDASAQHNLGTALLRTDRLEEAIVCYREAIRLRPSEPTTHLYLAFALEQLGQLTPATRSCKTALQLAPHDPLISDTYRRLCQADVTDNQALSLPGFLPDAPRAATKRRVKASIVIPVLDSHEVVRRQLLYLDRLIPEDWEVILLDDGSETPITVPSNRSRKIRIIATHNRERWTQGLARNLGASVARGDYLFMTDIDHIISPEAIAAVSDFMGARMIFPREYAALDDEGVLRTDGQTLEANGLERAYLGSRVLRHPVHLNTFAIQRQLFEKQLQGGYDRSLCGRGHYGGDDVELNDRYQRLVADGVVAADILGPTIYVFPDPAADRQRLFHTLVRN